MKSPIRKQGFSLVPIYQSINFKDQKTWHTFWSYYYMLYLLLIFKVSSCLRLTLLRVPPSRPAGHDVRLHCKVDPEGDSVYTIRWFHNGREFYRFSPGEDPSTMVFPAPGLKLDAHASSNTSVVLRDLAVESAGLFRCEVVADAPHFQTVAAEAFMVVGEIYNIAMSHASWKVLSLVVTCVMLHYFK